MSDVLTSVDDAIATITLDRPEALNAITVGMLESLRSAFDGLPAEVAVVVPEGSAFYAGWKGDADAVGSPSRIEGIGRPRVEASFVPSVIA